MDLSQERKSIISRYHASLGGKLFLAARWYLTPYEKMASFLPSQGKILDMGCGHGLFAMAAAMTGPGRQILGIDHDVKRIELARNAAQGMSNLEFKTGDMTQIPGTGYDGIALIDVMHYFPMNVQETIFENAYRALRAGGTILVREVEPSRGAVSAFNQLYEKIATTTGFTQTKKESLHFRTRQGWESALSAIGFQVRSEPCSSRLFADILYIGKKLAGL